MRLKGENWTKPFKSCPAWLLGLEAQAGFQPCLSCHISLMLSEEEQAIWGWGWGVTEQRAREGVGQMAVLPQEMGRDGQQHPERWSVTPRDTQDVTLRETLMTPERLSDLPRESHRYLQEPLGCPRNMDTAHPWGPDQAPCPCPVWRPETEEGGAVWHWGFSGGEGCGPVSSPAWPLGALTTPISQAAGLPVHDLQSIPLGTGA